MIVRRSPNSADRLLVLKLSIGFEVDFGLNPICYWFGILRRKDNMISTSALVLIYCLSGKLRLRSLRRRCPVGRYISEPHHLWDVARRRGLPESTIMNPNNPTNNANNGPPPNGLQHGPHHLPWSPWLAYQQGLTAYPNGQYLQPQYGAPPPNTFPGPNQTFGKIGPPPGQYHVNPMAPVRYPVQQQVQHPVPGYLAQQQNVPASLPQGVPGIQQVP